MRLSFETPPDYYNYAVKFSPFSSDLLASVASLNYGLQGQGNLFILDHSPGLGIRCLRELEWKPDALFDLTWSELSPSIVWTSSADGSVQIWDTGDVKGDPIYRKECRPVQVIAAHSSVCSSISWNQVRADPPSVVTSSWDKTIKLWDGITGNPVLTFTGHERLVYECSWSPQRSSTFASCSGDGTVRIWDRFDQRSSLIIDASRAEILSCDWCKYDSNILAFSTSDSTIKIMDLRSPLSPIATLTGHTRAVKKVRFNPHKKSILGSVSYDLTTRLWDYFIPETGSVRCTPSKSLIMTRQNHTEFVYGIDFNLHVPGMMVDCGWDHYIVIVHDSVN